MIQLGEVEILSFVWQIFDAHLQSIRYRELLFVHLS